MRTCLTCGKDISHKKGQAKHCDSKCYRRNPTVKKKYSDRTNEYQKKHATEINRRHQKLQYKSNFKNYQMDISIEEYETLLNEGCFYCSSSLLNETGAGLDRIDSDKGYLLSNVVPCCGKCNQIKNVHLTVNEMKVAMEAVIEYRNGE